MQKILIKNSFWSIAAKMAATVLFFAADILIARILDIDQYAEWAFFFAILSMTYYVFWFGVNGSVKVHVSKTLPEDEDRILCLQAGINVRTAVSLAIALLAFCIVLILPKFAFFQELCQRYPHLETLLMLAPLIAGLNSFIEFFKETEIGVQDYRAVFILTVLEYALILAAGVPGALLSHSSKGVGLGYLSAYCVSFLIAVILFRHWNHIRTFRASRTQECREYAMKIFRYALPLALIGIGGIVLVEMDTLMLGVLSTPETLSDYAIAKQICTKASHINNALAMGTMTSFSLITAENYMMKRKSFSHVTRVNTLVTLAAGGAMFIFADLAIKTLYGNKYAHAASIIRCLVPYYILYGMSAYFALFLDFHGKAGKRSLWYLIMVCINFSLNLVLIPSYGTTGACIGTTVSLIPYVLFLIYETYQLVWKDLRSLYEK